MQYLGEVLPNNMIPLAIPAGRKLLEEAQLKKESMVTDFQHQIGKTMCGPASLALIINTINAAYRVKLSDPATDDKTYDSLMKKMNSGEKLLLNENDIIEHGKVKEYIQELNVVKNGMTLLQLEHVAMLLGFGVNTYFAIDQELDIEKDKGEYLRKMVAENGDKYIFSNYKEFEAFVVEHISRRNSGLLLNYHMATLGYSTNFGHFSPAAANNRLILNMDVWPDTQPAWVDSKLMYDAMCSIDSDGGLPRGFLQIYELM